ncbi:MAG TPA: Hsp20/alpha crystallin family protein [Thermomicrobiales bacterium]|nr:Hsp20/alpha crystallin family protein [Thermomicrobiales bacterium]
MATRYPVSPVFGMRDAVDRLLSEAFSPGVFNTLWPTGNGDGTRSLLPIDAFATENEVVILAAIPGIRPDDIEITIEKNTVTLSGQVPNVAESEETKGANWYVHELAHGTFRRSLTLPMEVNANEASATFDHGMLRLTVPKAEAAKPRQIRVQVTGSRNEAITEEATAGESKS